MAGGDDKKLALLKRYASPLAAVDALHDVRTKMSKGEIKVVSALKAGATPEELKAWRADNGIPETPAGYDITIEEGHVWGDADKPVIDSFVEAAHKDNVPPSAVKAALKWFEGHQGRVIEQQQNEDAGFKKANIDELASEWGGALNREVAIASEFFQKMPDGLGDLLMGARDGVNGRLLMANAKLIRWANSMERSANPAATVMPGSGIHAAQAMETEIASIKTLMADPKSAYYSKGPEGKRLNDRYLQLLEAKEKQGRR
jgi:hypothetical protein